MPSNAGIMINYNPRDWFTFIFRFHKADTFRKLFPLIIAICIYAWIVAFLELEYFKLSENSHLKNLPILHNLLAFAISMLLVFRTNTAYDRWWEGRRLWGSLVNNSRNLAIKLAVMLPEDDEENRAFFRRTIPAYAFSLRNHLQAESTRLELFEEDKRKHALHQIDHGKHVPNQVAELLFKQVHQLYKEGKISGDQLIVLNGELQSFTDICGGCERIKNTPIPFSYSVFIKKFIFFYIMTLPFGHVFSLGYYMVPVCALVFYVMASLELIAEEIEDPFNGESNDIPTDKIAQTIQKTVAELI
ncbi:MAG: bestrophin family ion channel [Chitinophagaceae bacterium]